MGNYLSRCAALFCFLLTIVKVSAQQPYILQSDFTEWEVKSTLIDQKEVAPLAIKPWIASKYDLSKTWGFEKDTSKYYYGFTEKLFKEHLVEINKDKVSLTLDVLADLALGVHFLDSINPRSNVRGFMATGDIAGKAQFSTTFQESFVTPFGYVRAFTDTTVTYPGWGRVKFVAQSRDIGISTGWVSAPVTPWLRLTLGHGRHSFGHGHRGLLLSQNAPNYPYASADVWMWKDKIQYRMVFAEWQSLERKPLGEVPEALFKEKTATIHMITAKPLPFLELGIMQLTQWKRFDDLEGTQPFVWESLVPIPGYSHLREGFASERAVNAWAANISLEKTKWGRVYGQALWTKAGNPSAYQIGIEAFDLGLPNLHFAAEYNQIDAYAYSSSLPLLGWNHINQNTGSAIGANSEEWLMKLTYRKGRVYGRAQINSVRRASGESNDASILLPETTNAASRDINILFSSHEVGYLFNPKYNMRIYGRWTYRLSQGLATNEKDNGILIGFSTYLQRRNIDF